MIVIGPWGTSSLLPWAPERPAERRESLRKCVWLRFQNLYPGFRKSIISPVFNYAAFVQKSRRTTGNHGQGLRRAKQDWGCVRSSGRKMVLNPVNKYNTYMTTTSNITQIWFPTPCLQGHPATAGASAGPVPDRGEAEASHPLLSIE